MANKSLYSRAFQYLSKKYGHLNFKNQLQVNASTVKSKGTHDELELYLLMEQSILPSRYAKRDLESKLILMGL